MLNRFLSGATLVGLLMLGGCIQLRAPDKPIEINLNINIKQEVVIKLAKDVSDVIKNNPAAF